MNVISISVDAFLADMFCNHSSSLSNSILKHIANRIDYNLVPDRVMVDYDNVREVVNWNRVEKMQLIRCLIRCLDQDIDILDKIKPSLERFDYKIKELVHLLARKPHYIQHFPIDLDKISTSDTASILALGDDYFLNKINLSNHNFNFNESMKIIQGYNYNRDVIEKVNYKSLKGYQISEILIHTGSCNLDILDTLTLTNIDWLDLLEHQPSMLNLCDYDKFMNGDIFYSIKLCCMFEVPDLSYLVFNRDLKEITSFGWEKLLIEKPEKFLAHCNFNKLDDNNWKNIIKEYPQKYLCSIEDKIHIHVD